MKSILIAAAMTFILSACGGSSPSGTSSATTQAPIYVPPLNVPVPDSKPFTGAYVMIQGESLGYVSATSPRAIVEAVAAYVMGDPVKNATLYQAMLSDAGLKVTIVGEAIGKSAVTGAPLYAPNVVWTVKLTNGGVVVS